MDTNIKLILSGLAIALTFVAFVPYIRSILQGVTKPHVFSWVIWGTTTVIVFFAQVVQMVFLYDDDLTQTSQETP